MKSLSNRIAVWSLAVAALLGAACEGKKFVAPPVELPGYGSSAACVQGLARAYFERDTTRFEQLLAPNYIFLLNEPDPMSGETEWGRDTEVRIHRRMFRPQDFAMGPDPVPAENWLQSVDITLTPNVDFVERTDLYTTANPPGELDPTLWVAREGFYSASVFFQLAGDVDYQVNGRASFVVIEDKSKANGEVGKFMFYRWQDLGNNVTKIRAL